MRYSDEFKKKCIELYRKGQYPKTSDDIDSKVFHKQIRRWGRTAEKSGDESLRPRTHDRIWTADEKYELISRDY